MPDKKTPSLLEPESRGGENAGRGFDFQTHFLVSQIPCWLEYDGFASVLHEAIGDIEVKVYSPGYGESIEMIEAKNYRLTPAVFWEEIDRFYAAEEGSPNTFRWFRLVAPDISEELAPLQHGLRRLRSPYSFYPASSGVIQNSLADFGKLVTAAHKPAHYAEFLFSRVLIDTGYSIAQEHGEALFRQNFGSCLPQYQDLPYSRVSALYLALLNLVSPRNTPILRSSIEETIQRHIPAEQRPALLPVRLHTVHEPQDLGLDRKELSVDWVPFFGGKERVYPDAEAWNTHVIEELRRIKTFITTHRSVKHLHVLGHRRLSATLAIGSVFSATSRFVVMMEHNNGVLWRSDDHAGEDDAVDLELNLPERQGAHLIVVLGVPKNIVSSVRNYALRENAADLPLLNIAYTRPILSARQANAIVYQSKQLIQDALSNTGATKIHLFCAIPAFLALLLGHRINATAPVQCYEFVGADHYVHTCFLNT